MALSATHESTPVRRERLLFRGALAHALLALLGGASKRGGLDRGLKANTSKKRSLSLYRQRCFWYEAIPPWTTHASPSSRGSSMLFSKNREFTPIYSPHDDYDPELVALIPMGFCYPGTGRAGEKPPRPECAPLWHEPLLTRLPAERLEVIVGAYAQQRYVSHR